MKRWVVGLAMVVWPTLVSGQVRTWTDDTGKHKTEAEFISHEDGVVKLKKADGQVVELPLERLSGADREWVGRQSLSPDVKAYFEQVDRQRVEAITEAEAQLEKEQANIKKLQRAKDRRGVLKAKEEVRLLRERLESLRENDPPFMPKLDLRNLKVGDVGVLDVPETGGITPLWSLEVVDVVDEDEFLAVCSYSTTRTVVNRDTGVSVRRPGPRAREPVLWIRGLPTHDVASGDKLVPQWIRSLPHLPANGGKLVPHEPFRVAGTRQYETAGGGLNTVRVLELITLPDKHPPSPSGP
ncbi:MAG: SHD1 domain-containing protein [Planctomycetota bacterium]